MKSLKFKNLLCQYRENARLSKTDLGRKLRISPQYVMNLETGAKKPPNRDLCNRICFELQLSKEERVKLLFTAFYERLSDGDRQMFDELNEFINNELDGDIKSIMIM